MILQGYPLPQDARRAGIVWKILYMLAPPAIVAAYYTNGSFVLLLLPNTLWNLLITIQEDYNLQ